MLIVPLCAVIIEYVDCAEYTNVYCIQFKKKERKMCMHVSVCSKQEAEVKECHTAFSHQYHQEK